MRGWGLESNFDLPRLFGEIITILGAQIDFSPRLFSDEGEDWVEFDFVIEEDKGDHYFFEQSDIEDLADLLFETELDMQWVGISIEDQERSHPSGAVQQGDFYGYSDLQLLTSRDAVLQYKSQVELLKPKTPFETRLIEFFVASLGLIYATSECVHEFPDDDEIYSKNCVVCGTLVWDPDALKELTRSWH
jgi:hypothetical protein